MTRGGEGLITTEGVDEGSAASTAEGAGSGARPAVGSRPTAEGEQPAPPVEVDTADTRAARAVDTGQQLQAGEG